MRVPPIRETREEIVEATREEEVKTWEAVLVEVEAWVAVLEEETVEAIQARKAFSFR
jgi:hypothetical protein